MNKIETNLVDSQIHNPKSVSTVESEIRGEQLSLRGMRIIVVGAGPGGLVSARAAGALGAEVKVLEQAGDPRGTDPGYTNRSFNFTLNDVGRGELNDPRAWHGSTTVLGRAVHNYQNTGETFYTKYGEGPESTLTSIARPVFRCNLAALAEERGAILEFDTTVEDVDPDQGEVVYKKKRVKGGTSFLPTSLL